ncbi:probable transcription factor At1g11510 [Ricinus communis]|uniref:GeBP2 n=1 Tax=Ricinus communis TaxID=3988 RepID=B9SYW7_RICCO|nr:probable transcription factor At1g11510 [Ricinus communis]EEF31201.1 transcription regulator, putative [Ricinus communis]|eukprot:XP_002531186.1 probable transcription factor At1g11510 [Ricinus communis]
MDSNLNPLPQPNLKPQFSTGSSSATKLPIKRKTPNPNSYPLPFTGTIDPDVIPVSTVKPPPPFKLHRIWSEPDEIRFLQGLLRSTSDLSTFYDKFSSTTSSPPPQQQQQQHHHHPYTKSQLSQKLRRLRKKFRAISSRISRGLDPNLLSPHDRVLFDLSRKLWSPKDNSKMNSNSGSNISIEYAERVNLVGVQVDFSPVLPPFNNNNDLQPLDLDDSNDVDVAAEKASVVAKGVVKVFDECIKERLRCMAVDDKNDFERKWREQKAAEMDVFGRRLRLLLEGSVRL